jgi:hypothetical protein
MVRLSIFANRGYRHPASSWIPRFDRPVREPRCRVGDVNTSLPSGRATASSHRLHQHSMQQKRQLMRWRHGVRVGVRAGIRDQAGTRSVAVMQHIHAIEMHA